MTVRNLGRLFVVLVAVSAAQAVLAADVRPPRTGTAEFQPGATESTLPERFQLKPHTFEFKESAMPSTAPTIRVSSVTFPSPMITPHKNNNTIHTEYYCPTTPGKHPGVIVLHILGGDFDLSRIFCRALASRGIAGLFMIMPYYGPRQEPGVETRMISMEPDQTVKGMTQAVLDVRQSAAWLASQEEIDQNQLGIMGISLGGITGALCFSLEPRFAKACLLLAGGDMGEVAWTSTEMTEVREKWIKSGGDKESLFKTLKVVDPVTYARPMPGRKILMLNAKNDEVVPPACTESLWRAFGKPEIVWWDAGHYTAVRYIGQGMMRTVKFFEPDSPSDAQSTAK